MGISLGRYALAAAIALLCTGNGAGATTFKLKIGAGHPPAGLWIATLRDVFMPRVAERVAKETPHKIEWTEGFGGSVCKLGECLEAIESGLLDIGDAHAPFEPAKMLAHNFAYFAPFGTPDPRVAAKAVREVYERTPALRKVLEDRYNQVFIAAGVVSSGGLGAFALRKFCRRKQRNPNEGIKNETARKEKRNDQEESSGSCLAR